MTAKSAVQMQPVKQRVFITCTSCLDLVGNLGMHLDLRQRELGLHVIPIIIITHSLPPCTVRVTFDICCSNCSMLCLFEAYYVSLLCPRLDACFGFQHMCKTTYTEYGFPVPFTLFLCTHQWFAPGWGGKGGQPQGSLTFLR